MTSPRLRKASLMLYHSQLKAALIISTVFAITTMTEAMTFSANMMMSHGSEVRKSMSASVTGSNIANIWSSISAISPHDSVFSRMVRRALTILLQKSPSPWKDWITPPRVPVEPRARSPICFQNSDLAASLRIFANSAMFSLTLPHMASFPPTFSSPASLRPLMYSCATALYES